MIRELIERAAYNNLCSIFPDKAHQVKRLVHNGEKPRMIAEWLGNRQAIHWSIILLAANHISRELK